MHLGDFLHRSYKGISALHLCDSLLFLLRLSLPSPFSHPSSWCNLRRQRYQHFCCISAPTAHVVSRLDFFLCEAAVFRHDLLDDGGHFVTHGLSAVFTNQQIACACDPHCSIILVMCCKKVKLSFIASPSVLVCPSRVCSFLLV